MSEPKIFISYSHDSDEHCEFVRGISNRLRKEGLNCRIDKYINGFPPEGWPRWMEKQIKQADFVLLVCTPNYLRRYEGEERDGGRGVTFEGVVISQALYESYYHNTKFIPVIPVNGNYDHVPIPLKQYSSYQLPTDYDNLYRVLTGQAEYVAPPLGSIRPMPPANTKTQTSTKVPIDRLPTVKGEFFGRVDELKLLNNAWASNDTRIIQFVAPGGTGKTKLLRHWLGHTDNIDTLIAWSFYSQGASEGKQISATPFFSHVFEMLGSTRTKFTTEEDKGEHLAALLRKQRSVLVLDGLEPLQHVGKGMQGELKDRAIRQLLKTLTGQNNGLCIITTRIALPELRDNPHVISQELENLALDDGVKLLQSLGVHGQMGEFQKAVKEYGCHALALHLLGNALHTYLDGDVCKRDTLTELIGDDDAIERHAFRVMQAYSYWLADTAELKLLQLLGLFDHPIELEVLQALWQAQIPALTAGIKEKAWKIAIRDLREKHRLLAANEHNPNQLDCHPLIREYFDQQLRKNQFDAWQQAHARLYDYYKAQPEKEFPDTVVEMQPLFSAVAHGCAAGLHQQALDEVYWPRIQRKEDYLVHKLGAYSDDLAVVANFFTTPWHTLAADLTDEEQAVMLGRVGFGLRALGRLREALEPMQAAIERLAKQKDWKVAAQAASNLSELQLTLGDVAAAAVSGQKSVDYADQSEGLFHRMSKRTAHADALHQAGETGQALERFIAAEQIQQECQPEMPRLYSRQGFDYCDLLLAQGTVAAVLGRAEQTLEWAKQGGGGLLTIALDQLTLGRAYYQQGNFPQATDWLGQAVAGLREAGTQDHLPRGLLARAALNRDIRNPNHDFSRARQDLEEVLDIAEPSGMRLHLTDYHLEMARLLIAEQQNSPQIPVEKGESELSLQDHITQATKLIAETGYMRRLPELQALQKQVAG